MHRIILKNYLNVIYLGLYILNYSINKLLKRLNLKSTGCKSIVKY